MQTLITLIKTKRLPKYIKNENKLHLKEDVEKSTKTRGKEHKRLERQHDGFKKDANCSFSETKFWLLRKNYIGDFL